MAIHIVSRSIKSVERDIRRYLREEMDDYPQSRPPRRPRPLCGARTRQGRPCKRKARANGRCPNHGGLSTGPKTRAGKQRIAEANRQRWQQWRLAQGVEA